ncbi:MAG TPA: type 4a pilus biogenesis protein PilO [Gaiellaceae bacterium]|jgi:hypothetical protein
MKKLGAGGALAASIAAVLLVAVVGWFMFVSPERSKSSDLDAKNAAESAQLASLQHVLATTSDAKNAAALRAAKRALPDTPQMSQVLRQLSSYVTKTQAELDTITPAPLVAAAAGGEAVPLTVTVKGRYFELQQLMKLLRRSADVQGKNVTGTGRLYSVDGIQFGAAASTGGTDSGASQSAAVTATISLNAFVYGSAATAAATTAAATDAASTTSSSGTTDSSAASATP